MRICWFEEGGGGESVGREINDERGLWEVDKCVREGRGNLREEWKLERKEMKCRDVHGRVGWNLCSRLCSDLSGEYVKYLGFLGY